MYMYIIYIYTLIYVYICSSCTERDKVKYNYCRILTGNEVILGNGQGGGEMGGRWGERR